MTTKFTEAAVDALAQHLAEEDGFVIFAEHVLAQFRPKARFLLGIVAKHEQPDPPKEAETMLTLLTVRLPLSMKRDLLGLAHRRRCTVSTLVRAAVEQLLSDSSGKNVRPSR